MDILKRVEAHDLVVFVWRIQVAVIAHFYEAPICDSGEAELICRELGMLQIGGGPEYAGAIAFCCMQHPRTPSATQVENSVSLSHSKFPTNVIEHFGLCRLQVNLRTSEVP